MIYWLHRQTVSGIIIEGEDKMPAWQGSSDA